MDFEGLSGRIRFENGRRREFSLDITELTQKGLKKVNKGANPSALVLLNLLNEFGKSDKMRGLPSILSFFRNKFDKFNNTRARTIDSFYHMTLKLI